MYKGGEDVLGRMASGCLCYAMTDCVLRETSCISPSMDTSKKVAAVNLFQSRGQNGIFPGAKSGDHMEGAVLFNKDLQSLERIVGVDDGHGGAVFLGDAEEVIQCGKVVLGQTGLETLTTKRGVLEISARIRPAWISRSHWY